LARAYRRVAAPDRSRPTRLLRQHQPHRRRSTIHMDRVYFAARWDQGTADYINRPFTKEEYEIFLDALITAEAVPAKSWEQIPTYSGTPSSTWNDDSRAEAKVGGSVTNYKSSEPVSEKLQYFEGCLPIEETARRGRDTLRFGPMKPAGLTNPKTGRWPYAVVQLRQE